MNIKFGVFLLIWSDLAKDRALREDGVLVKVEPKALRVLHALIEADGQTVSKKDLLKSIWGEAKVVDDVVTSAVRRLRKAMRESREDLAARGLEHGHIVNVARYGYKFNREIERKPVRSSDVVDVPTPNDNALAGAAAEGGAGALPRGDETPDGGVERPALTPDPPPSGRDGPWRRSRWLQMWVVLPLAVAGLLISGTILGVLMSRSPHENMGGVMGTPIQQTPGGHDLNLVINDCQPAVPDGRANTLLELARQYYKQSEYAKAEPCQRKAVVLLERQQGPGAPDTLSAEFELAGTLDQERKYDEASSVLAQAVLHGGTKLQIPSELAMAALSARAGHELIQERPDRARVLYEQLDQMRMKVVPADRVWRFKTRDNLAWCSVRMNHPDEAAEILQELMEPQYTSDEVGPISWVKAHLQYATALSSLRRLPEAEVAALSAVNEAQEKLGVRHYVTGVAWDTLASIQLNMGELPQALASARHTYWVLAGRFKREEPAMLMAGSRQASLEFLTAPSAHTLDGVERAYESLASKLKPEMPAAQLAAFIRALALTEMGRAEEAAPLLEGLKPEALAAADASGHWAERIEALKGYVEWRAGQKAVGLHKIQAAGTSMKRSGGEGWILRRIEHDIKAPLRAVSPHRAHPVSSSPGQHV